MISKADIKLGYDCNNNCVHCVIADQRDYCKKVGRSINRDTQEFIYELNDSRLHGCDGVIFTGGEPTIRKDIFILLKHAQKIGFEIAMQTNGRMFYYLNFAERFVKYNINYAIALHGHNASIHDSITRVRGSFEQTTKGIKNLLTLGITSISGKTVISRFNYKYLPEIVKLFLNFGLRRMNFAFPHANGNARKYFDIVVPTYTEIMDYVYQAIEIVKEYERKMGISIYIDFEAIPFCLMRGYEKYISDITYIKKKYIELKQLNFKTRDWNSARRQQKLKFPQCRKCKYDTICEGIWKEYPEKRGYKEFVSVK